MLQTELSADDGGEPGGQEENLKLFRSYVFGREDPWVFNSAVVPLAKAVLARGGAQAKTKLFRLFAHCAVRKDFCSILCSDRRENCIMSYMHQVDHLLHKMTSLIRNVFFSGEKISSSRATLTSRRPWPCFSATLPAIRRAEMLCYTFQAGKTRYNPKDMKDIESGNFNLPHFQATGDRTSNAQITSEAALHCLKSYNPCLKVQPETYTDSS